MLDYHGNIFRNISHQIAFKLINSKLLIIDCLHVHMKQTACCSEVIILCNGTLASVHDSLSERLYIKRLQ